MKTLLRLFQIILLVVFCIIFRLSPNYAQAANSQINVTVNPTVIAPPPTITSPTSGTETTQSSITVTGTAEQLSTVKIYVNSIQMASVVISSSGAFSVSAPLTLGVNNITGTTTNIIGTSPQSTPILVTRILPPTPPSPAGDNAPTTSSPSTNIPSSSTTTNTTTNTNPPSAPIIENIPSQHTSSSESITLIGTAEPNSTVVITLNGKEVATITADDKGYFEITLYLVDGVNTVSFIARNQNGESKATVLSITFTSNDNQDKSKQTDITKPSNNLKNTYFLTGIVIFILLIMWILFKKTPPKR